MNLEDHLGDILRKARGMNQVPTAAAANAAGIPESEFTTLEETGHLAQKINFTTLAPLVGLNPAKLEGIAQGWRPAPANLDRWRTIRAFTTADDGMTVNCYLVWDAATRAAALFDTGFDAQPLLGCLAENQLDLKYVFITHSHYDHVEALPAIRAAFPQAQLRSSSQRVPAGQRNQPAEIVQLGGLRVSHRPTPGHAEDGVTYLISNWQENAPTVAVVGDAIFAGSMGRGNDSWAQAKQKVREEILSLPSETLICPGHGPLTTVAEEQAHNPFF